MLKKLTFIFAGTLFLLSTALGLWIVNCNTFLNETIVTKDITVEKNEPFITTYRNLIKGLTPPLLFKRYMINVVHFHSKRKYGVYRVENRPLMEMVQKIQTGKQHQVKITFPEGFTIQDIAKTASKLQNITESNIVDLSTDSAFINEVLNNKYQSLEGFLYPDTYLLPPNSSAKTLLRMMVDNFKRNLPKNFESSLKSFGLNYYEGITLASIIQKETFKTSEYPIVASVFYNRLKFNMRLQSDPTVIYGIPNFNGNIRKKDLLNKNNSYNTYRHNGLTPTPICSPSIGALNAVIAPASTKFLYFVADKKGGHVFSKNYKEHRKNVRTYQLRR